jgi:hypothetical protein
VTVSNIPQTVNALTLSNNSKASANANTPAAKKGEEFWGDDGFTFGDVIDIINPLQHIPVVSSIYQSISGDEQSNGSKIAGGALYGGILGIFTSFFDSTLEQETGKNAIAHVQELGGNILASFTSDDDSIPILIAELDTEAQDKIAAVREHASNETQNLSHLSEKEAAEVKTDIANKTLADIQAIAAYYSDHPVSAEAIEFWWKDWKLEKTLEVADSQPLDPNKSNGLSAEELALLSAPSAYQNTSPTQQSARGSLLNISS